MHSARFERLIWIILLLLIFLMAARTPLDSDLWWHLRSGQETWNSGQPLISDPFSYTRFGQSWINHSWLAQVCLYLIFQAGSYPALSALVALLAVLQIELVYRQMEGPAGLRAFLLVLATPVIAVVWSPRPQLASLTLLAVLGWLLYRYKWQQRNEAWLLPILFVFWSNLHGGYPLGLMLLGTFIAGEILNHALGWKGPEVVAWPRIARLALWTLAAVLVLPINPNGLNIWRIPFQTVGVNVLQQFVSEWASPDFHDLAQQPFLWLLFACLAAIGLSGRRLDGGDLLSVIWFGALALVARRNFGPFALLATPVLARHAWPALLAWNERIHLPARLQNGLLKVRSTQQQGQLTPGYQRGLNLAIVALIGFFCALKLFIVTHPALIQSAEQTAYPVKAVEWLQDNRPPRQLFSTYNWGGYLVWALPEYPVFVDGRTDLYGDEIIGAWMQTVHAGDDWQATLDKWQVNTLLLDPGQPLAKAACSAGWKLLYEDQVAVIYGR